MARTNLGLTLRWKIVGPYAVLALAVAMFGAFLVTRLVVGSLAERFTNQLVESGRVTADSVVRQEREHLLTVRTITFTDGLASAVALDDANELEAIALPVAANQGAQRVEILDRSGQRLLGARLHEERYEPITDNVDRTAWPFVERVLTGEVDPAGDKFAGIVQTSDGLVLYSAGAVRDETGRIIGAVLVGTDLNTFVRRAKADALADVTIYDAAGDPVATSFALDLADPDAGLTLAGPVESVRAGRTVQQALFGREYEALFNELRVRGEPWGWYSVALPRTFIAASASTARGQLSVFFAVATLGVLIVGWALARSLTGPLHRLVNAADAVSRGDLSARSGVHSRDEIGELASAFDSMAGQLQRQHVSTLSALVSAIDARDAYTRGHSVRVGHLASDLGRALGFSSKELQHLQVGGMLHDIGKIGIRDDVLLKPGRLSAEERTAIQEHPRIGLKILETVDLPTEVLAGVGGHHERLDGSGYPNALSGDQLLIFPRIISVADVYDALITDRPYRGALPLSEVLRMLDEEVERGLLDPEVVKTMHRIAFQWEGRRRHDKALEGFTLDPAILSRGERLIGVMSA